MYTQNAPVLTCNPKFRNAIRFLTMTNKALEKKSDLKINIEENSVDDNVNNTDIIQKFPMVPCYFGMSSDSDES